MKAFSNSPFFEVRDLIFHSGQEPKIVSFTLEPGGSCWITGPSGYGKSTLLRTIARLNLPSGGDMLLEGQSWRNIPAEQWRSRVLYVHQKSVMFRGSVLDNLEKPFTLRNRTAFIPDMRKAEQDLLRLLLPRDILKRDALTLSVGEASRVVLVRSMLVNPQVLLLDELTAGLDVQSRDATTDLLKEWLSVDGRALVGVSHESAPREALGGYEILLTTR